MITRLSPRSAAVILVTSILAGACDSSTAPSTTSVAGIYSATAFTTTTSGVTTDQLAAGATVALVLSPQGSTTGELFIPDAGEGGGDFVADLQGTWTLNGGTVQLSHAADTFLRDMPLTVQGNTLVGDRTFGSTRVQLTLTKQSIVAL